jgi:hypothetical protein
MDYSSLVSAVIELQNESDELPPYTLANAGNYLRINAGGTALTWNATAGLTVNPSRYITPHTYGTNIIRLNLNYRSTTFPYPVYTDPQLDSVNDGGIFSLSKNNPVVGGVFPGIYLNAWSQIGATQIDPQNAGVYITNLNGSGNVSSKKIDHVGFWISNVIPAPGSPVYSVISRVSELYVASGTGNADFIGFIETSGASGTPAVLIMGYATNAGNVTITGPSGPVTQSVSKYDVLVGNQSGPISRVILNTVKLGGTKKPPRLLQGVSASAEPLGSDSDFQFYDSDENIQTIVSCEGITSPVISIGNATATVYSLPTVLGSPNQVLSVPATGTQLVWTTGSSPGSNYTAGQNIDPTALTGDIIGTLDTVTFTNVTTENAIIQNISGPSNTVSTNSQFEFNAAVNPLSSCTTFINNDSITIADVSTASTRYSSSFTQDSIGFTVSSGGNVTAKSRFDATQIVVPSIKVGEYGGTILYQLPSVAPGPNQILESNSSGVLQWGTFSQSGIQSITTSTPSDLQISTASGICTINYVGSSSGITAGTNLTLTGNVLSLNDALTLTNLGSLTCGNMSVAGSELSESSLLLKDALGNVMSVTSNILQISNGASTFASVNENGIYGQTFKVINPAGTVLYSLPSVLGSPNQVLSVAPSGTQLVWANSGGSGSTYYGSTNITINANNDILLNAVIDLGAGSSLQADSLIFENAQNDSILTVSTSGLDYVDSSQNAYYSLRSSGCQLYSLSLLSSDRTAVSYSFPSSQAVSGQVLAWPSTGSTLQWMDQPGALTPGNNISIVDGTISVTYPFSLSDGDNTLSLTNQTFTLMSDSIFKVAINDNVSYFQGLSIHSANDTLYSFPQVGPTNGQFLVAENNQLIWSSSLGNVPQFISLLPSVITAEYESAQNSYKVGFLGLQSSNSNIQCTTTNVNLSDTLALTNAGSLNIGDATTYSNLASQQLTLVNASATTTITPQGIEVFNSDNKMVSSCTLNGVFSQGISMVDANENTLYSLPQSAPQPFKALQTDLNGNLLWGDIGGIGNSIFYNCQPTMNGSGLLAWDTVTTALTRIELKYMANIREILILPAFELYLDGNQALTIDHTVTQIPMEYWPTDLYAQGNNSFTRVLGEYVCTLGTGSTSGFQNIITVGVPQVEYLSQNLTVSANFSRVNSTDATFALVVSFYYPNQVYSTGSQTVSYGWSQGSGFNAFGGGGQEFILISNRSTNYEQKFVY